MRKIKILILICSFSIAKSSFSQDTEIGNWFVYLGNQNINKKLNWHNEVQYRNYNFVGDLQQLILRTGVGYNLSENNNNILLGYAYVYGQNYTENFDEKINSTEHRVYQQWITRQNFNRVFVQHRYRVEERFLTDEFQMRFRYFLAMQIPLNNKEMIKNSVYVSAYNELFVNGQDIYFDRNRIYGGLGFVLDKNFRIETGFMQQKLQSNQRGQFQIIFINNLPIRQN